MSALAVIDVSEPSHRRPPLVRPSAVPTLHDVNDATPSDVDFEECAQEALDSLPPELRESMSNVAIVIEDEPPEGQSLLGLYQGVPLTKRGADSTPGKL